MAHCHIINYNTSGTIIFFIIKSNVNLQIAHCYITNYNISNTTIFLIIKDDMFTDYDTN